MALKVERRARSLWERSRETGDAVDGTGVAGVRG
jgi:hypothetical protein